MKKIKTNEKGFTLIEVIVTLILVGITAALAGMWIVSVANGYIFAKTNASTTQKAQLAMTRLTKEFSAIQTVTATSASPASISYTRTEITLGTPVAVTTSLSGNELQLHVNNTVGAPQTLTDSVSSFALEYCDEPTCSNTLPFHAGTSWLPSSRIIKITLILTAGDNTPITFIQRVAPRNL